MNDEIKVGDWVKNISDNDFEIGKMYKVTESKPGYLLLSVERDDPADETKIFKGKCEKIKYPEVGDRIRVIKEEEHDLELGVYTISEVGTHALNLMGTEDQVYINEPDEDQWEYADDKPKNVTDIEKARALFRKPKLEPYIDSYGRFKQRYIEGYEEPPNHPSMPASRGRRALEEGVQMLMESSCPERLRGMAGTRPTATEAGQNYYIDEAGYWPENNLNKGEDMSIVTRVKNLTLSKDDKALREAGFQGPMCGVADGEWSSQAWDVVKDKLMTDHKDYLIDVAKKLNAEDKD